MTASRTHPGAACRTRTYTARLTHTKHKACCVCSRSVRFRIGRRRSAPRFLPRTRPESGLSKAFPVLARRWLEQDHVSLVAVSVPDDVSALDPETFGFEALDLRPELLCIEPVAIGDVAHCARVVPWGARAVSSAVSLGNPAAVRESHGGDLQAEGYRGSASGTASPAGEDRGKGEREIAAQPPGGAQP